MNRAEIMKTLENALTTILDHPDFTFENKASRNAVDIIQGAKLAVDGKCSDILTYVKAWENSY